MAYQFTQTGAEIQGILNSAENATNKVTSLSSVNTNTQYPSAKVVYDTIQANKNIYGTYALNADFTDEGEHTITDSTVISALATLISGAVNTGQAVLLTSTLTPVTMYSLLFGIPIQFSNKLVYVTQGSPYEIYNYFYGEATYHAGQYSSGSFTDAIYRINFTYSVQAESTSTTTYEMKYTITKLYTVGKDTTGIYVEV